VKYLVGGFLGEGNRKQGRHSAGVGLSFTDQ
jgi:hypothetical protein